MKTTALALAALAVLGGCAGVQTSNGGTAAAPRATTYYCAQERLNPRDDGLECNWHRTTAAACLYTETRVLDRASIAGEPQPAGRCITGQTLVKVAPR